MYKEEEEEKRAAMMFMSSVHQKRGRELNNACQNIHIHSSRCDSCMIIVIVSADFCVDMHRASSLFDRVRNVRYMTLMMCFHRFACLCRDCHRLSFLVIYILCSVLITT